MDSHSNWRSLQVGARRSSNIDLTLKLWTTEAETNQAEAPFVPNRASHEDIGLHIGGPSHAQGINSYQSQVMSNASAWPQMERNAQYMQPNYVHVFGDLLSAGSLTAAAAAAAAAPPPVCTNPPPHQPHMINPNFNMSPSTIQLPPLPRPPPAGNVYTLIDVPARRARANRELLIGSSSSGAAGGSRLRSNDDIQRCTNYNCNTSRSSMWRKGPLGHKTLCNACGIKYRKEEDKRRAREAAAGRRFRA